MEGLGWLPKAMPRRMRSWGWLRLADMDRRLADMDRHLADVMSSAIGPRGYGAFCQATWGPKRTSFLFLHWAWQSSFLSIVFPSEIQRGRAHATPPLIALESIDKQSVAGTISIGTYGSSLQHGRLSQPVTALSIALSNNLCG